VNRKLPKDDRRPNPQVSEFEKSQTMEICPNCGDLRPFGSSDCTCGVPHMEYKDRFTKFKKSE